MGESSNWWGVAYKNPWLAGTLVVIGFGSGFGAYHAGLKHFRQDTVTADTYVLKSDKDYVSPESYAQAVRERDEANQKLEAATHRDDELTDQLKQRDALIAALGDRKQVIADLENMRTDAEKKLEGMRRKLAMESEMTVLEARRNDRQESGGGDLYQGTKRDISSIEQNIRDIDQKILELKSIGK